MKKSKRIISLLLSVIMLISVFQTGFVAFAADGTQYVLDATEAKQLADAGAVTEATQVVRVAKTFYSYDVGTTIVPATPSGISANDERGIANAGNVEETASYPVVKITFKDLPSEVPQITCVNSNSAVSSDVVMTVATFNEAEKSYTWHISSGTANVGDTLKYIITYTYNGRQYTSNAYSYVESVAMPAGNYVETKTKYESGLFGWGSNYYAGISAATRVLGINTYGSLESFTVSSSDLRGYYDASANSFVTRSGADYSAYNVIRDQSTRDENSTLTYAINDRRAYADVYVDTSVTDSFADLNLRFSVANVKKIGGNDTQTLDNVVAKQGNVSADSGLTGTGDYALGTDSRTGVMAVGDDYVTTFTGQTITNGAEYTIITKLSSSHSGAANATYFPVGLRIHTVDKGALRARINDILHNYIPENPTTSAAYKGVNPQSWYYSAGFSAYEKAMLDAQTVLQNPRSTQAEIDNAVTTLTDAYNGLVLAEADYSNVEAAIADANEYEATKHLYTDDSYNALMQAISIYDAETNPDGKIQYGFSVLFQPQVDEWEAEIRAAIENLDYRLADYTELNGVYAEALEVVENEHMYVDISGVEFAINNIDWNVKSTEQKKVDDMVELLRDAIDSLSYVKANYDAVNAAIAEVQKYSSSNYTPESYQNLRDIITSIDYDLDINQQETVDNYVTLIEQAIEDLEELPADYVELEALLAEIDALVEAYYTEDTYSAVKDAAAECEGYKEIGITRQSEIDEMVVLLKDAISKLEMYDASYKVVNDYINEFNNLDQTQITQDSLNRVKSAIDAVNWDLKIDRQSDVDDYALAIRVAIDSLEYNKADYSEVNLAVQKANGIDRTYWTADSIAKLDAAVAGVQYGLGVNRQEDVDAMANAINTAINTLQPGPADYTRVNEAINRYVAMNPDYYTPASKNKVQSIIDGINWNLTKAQQDVVNGYATDISFAILDLVPAQADYTELDAIIDSIPENLDALYTKDSIDAVEDILITISENRDLMAKDQAIVVGYQNALTEAINNLKYLTGDYSDVDAAIAEGRAIIEKNDPPISEDSIAEFEALVASLDRTYTIKQEAEIAALALQVRNAYRGFSHAESIHKASITLEADKTVTYSGDIVTVSVIVGTDYYAAASSIPVLYDAQYFEPISTNYEDTYIFEGSYAAGSEKGANLKSPSKGYPSSYDEQDKAQWKYALVSFVPSSDLNPEAQILDPAQTVVKMQFRVLSNNTQGGYKARIWVDEAFLKTDDNKTGKLYIGRYESSVVSSDAVVTVGQDIDLTNATVGLSVLSEDSPAVFTELKSALMLEPQYSESFYTDVSYKAYADAVAVGNEVITHEGEYTVKEQKVIDDAAKAINDAYKALELKPADTTPLDNALKLTPYLPLDPVTQTYFDNPEDVYTAESLSAYNDAVSAGKAILAEEGLTVVDNDRINAAAQEIVSTFEGLTYKPFKWTEEMNAALATNPEYDAEYYTTDSYAAYTEAYTALEAFKNSNPSFLNDDEGQDLIYKLTVARRNLKLKPADLTALKEAINTQIIADDGEIYDSSFYTEETYNAYVDAIDAGNSIVNAEVPLTILEQGTVDEAEAAIYTAMEGLKFKPFSYKELGTETSNLSYDGDKNDYTTESLSRFTTAKNALRRFIRNSKLDIRNDAEGLELINNVLEAYDNLEFKPVDTSYLDEALALDAMVGDDPSYYDLEDYNAFKDAVAAAEAEIAARDGVWRLSEAEIINNLAQAIYDAYNALEFLPFSKLPELNEAIINKAQYEAEVYEENAYAEYDAARQAIVDMIADAEAGKLTIAHDNDAVEAIERYNTALAALDNAILDADYTEVDRLIEEEAQQYIDNEAYYNNVDALKAAIQAVENDRERKAYDQHIVDGYEEAILEALKNVVEKPGNYEKVDAAIVAANEKISKVKEFETMGAPIIPGTLEALEQALASVDTTLGITQQETIDGYATAIEEATAALDNVSTILISEDSDLYLEEDSVYGYTYLRGYDVIFNELSEADIISNFDTYGANTRIVVVPVNEVQGAKWYGTGTRVQHYDGDELVKEYIIVIDGDVNGDGAVDSIDVSIVSTHINEFTEPGLDLETYENTTPWFMAAVDLCRDWALDVIDLTIVISIVNMDNVEF